MSDAEAEKKLNPSAEREVELGRDAIEDPHEDSEFVLETRDDQLVQGSSFLSTCLGVVCFPFSCCCSFYTLEPNEEAVIVQCGTYTEKVTEPGCHYSSCWGRDMYRMTRRQISRDLPTIKCLDSSGNPIMVSAVLVTRYERTERAALALRNVERWVLNMATSTLRKVVSTFPYETDDDSPSLKTHQSMVSRRLQAAAQKMLQPAGAHVVAFQVNELSYAPEIASAMLKRQQADALVGARRVLVEGCAAIALDSVRILEDSGVSMSDSEKVSLLNNVITVTASDGGTSNVIDVGLGHR